MTNSLKLKGYQSIGSIVSRNSDGKEYMVSSYGKNKNLKTEYILVSASTSEEIKVTEESGQLSEYAMVSILTPSMKNLSKMRQLDMQIENAIDQCYEVFKRKFDTFDLSSDSFNELQELTFEKIKHESGYYDLRIERAKLLSIMRYTATTVNKRNESSVQETYFPIGSMLEELDLNTRAYNCLKRHGVNTLAELIRMSREDMENVRNLGRSQVDLIEQEIGYTFK